MSITEHRFLDEAGDTTFYGKGRKLIVGDQGVSRTFSIGMVKVDGSLDEIRAGVVALQKSIEEDSYLNVIPSVRKKIDRGGFFFHATDDPPEVRQIFYKYLQSQPVSIEVMMARKIPDVYIRKHNSKESEFYADLLSHLIKNKFKLGGKLVLNIASRANTTSNSNLEKALEKAMARATKSLPDEDFKTRVVFNVQNHLTEPLLNIADYLCWSVQRVFERGDTRYYDYLGDKVSLVVDLYDQANYKGSKHYYRGKNRLTAENKIGPLSP